MSRQVGRNEKCPCGSGDKYKRCCLRSGREWARDGRGRLIPAPFFSYGFTHRTLTSMLDHLEDAGRLNELIFETHWNHITPKRAMAMLSPAERTSVFVDMGMPSPTVLFTERTGDMPQLVVWEHWENTGEWLVHPNSSLRYRTRTANGLAAVIQAYPHLPTGEGSPTPCQFRRATLVHSERHGPVFIDALDAPDFPTQETA